MADYTQYYEARNIITDILQKDFIGPVTEDEVLNESPLRYYIMGKLYGQNNSTDSEEDPSRNPFLENETEEYDANVSLSNQREPASMGITFTLKDSVDKIKINLEYASYIHFDSDAAAAEGIKINKNYSSYWKRRNYKYEKIIDISNKTLTSISLEGNAELQLFNHGNNILTAVLINRNFVTGSMKEEERGEIAIFQPKIHISSCNDNKYIFADTTHRTNLSSDHELQDMELLYSSIKCFAQGHGCSVQWDLSGKEPEWIETAFLPEYNLRQMMPNTSFGNEILSMKYLYSAPSDEVIRKLYEFIEDYKRWIKDRRTDAESLPENLREPAERNLSNCDKAFNTICKSIKALDDSSKGDGIAYRAFQLANEVMFRQRAKQIENSGKSFNPDELKWYPFQIAFMLQEMISFIDPTCTEREDVDLLWFPTGGGKTEAYLGIAAFVIFLRRLRNCEDDGVTVIMRYTLRLLTLQQFERASAMICACEILRKKYDIGGKELGIGLWVGGQLTPNSLKETESVLNKLKSGKSLKGKETSPVQIHKCPWCKSDLTYENYGINSIKKRMEIKCSNPSCDFEQECLPIHIIDEDIYENQPEFIVATVDKFAQITLSEKPANLFGIGIDKKPPELIIQDELHLISGPLGTMTGLYEAAITRFCEKDGIKVKIVASTATIRNAENQIKALYGRKHTQFPPQALSSADSFFAIESKEKDRPARKYLGVMGVGTSATSILIRINAALLFASRYLATKGFPDSVVDNFWTITGYFNSLRELGGASTQIMDDVQSRFNYLTNTKFHSVYPGVEAKPYNYVEELTSRMSNDDITEMIQDKLTRKYTSNKHVGVYDFVLASNMISVGVDVGRLGTMVVVGQPKTNAEYIQASSRVGRENPGLVITSYNSSKSRDRSHYEQFLKYHTALYRYVESTSLTPFADRARDRGLHALFVALCRYLIPELLSNESAGNFNQEDPRVKEIEKMILNYVAIVDPEESDHVKDELKNIMEEWAMSTGGGLSYIHSKIGKNLLKQDTDLGDRFRTMNSMRNVDKQSTVYLK